MLLFSGGGPSRGPDGVGLSVIHTCRDETEGDREIWKRGWGREQSLDTCLLKSIHGRDREVYS